MSDLGKADLTAVALAHTFVLGFMIWAGGNVSGANYNGAVTLGLLVTKHFAWLKALMYL